jgi:hypothetical protein
MRAWCFAFAAAAGCLAGCGDKGPDCKAVSFPAAPSDAKDTVYVASACPADVADGSRERPFATIADAVAHASDGATILVAEDSEYGEDLVISRSVHLLGAASTATPEEVTTTLRPKGGGITVQGGAQDVLIRGFEIDHAKGFGVRVTGGAQASLEGLMIQGTEDDGDGQFGYGIVVDGGAAAKITGTTVQSAASVGVYVDHAGAELHHVRVESVLGRGGIRVEDAQGVVAIHDSVVDTCKEVGILVSNSTATLHGTNVLGTKVASSGLGDGIVVRRRPDDKGQYPAAASADIQAAVVTSAGRVGIVFSEGATGSISQSTITSCGANSGWGAGVWLQSGAGGDDGVLVTQSTIRANSYIGLGVTNGARARIVQNTTIGETVASVIYSNDQYVSVGDGIGVFNGARATIESNGVGSNQRFGVILDNPAAGSTLQGNSIHDNGQFGLVVQRSTSGIPPFSDNTFENNGFGSTSILGPNESAFPVHANDFATP